MITGHDPKRDMCCGSGSGCPQGVVLLQELAEFLPGNGSVRVMEDDEFRVLSSF